MIPVFVKDRLRRWLGSTLDSPWTYVGAGLVLMGLGVMLGGWICGRGG